MLVPRPSAEALLWGPATRPFLFCIFFSFRFFRDAKLRDYQARTFTIEMVDVNGQILKGTGRLREKPAGHFYPYAFSLSNGHHLHFF